MGEDLIRDDSDFADSAHGFRDDRAEELKSFSCHHRCLYVSGAGLRPDLPEPDASVSGHGDSCGRAQKDNVGATVPYACSGHTWRIFKMFDAWYGQTSGTSSEAETSNFSADVTALEGNIAPGAGTWPSRATPAASGGDSSAGDLQDIDHSEADAGVGTVRGDGLGAGTLPSFVNAIGGDGLAGEACHVLSKAAPPFFPQEDNICCDEEPSLLAQEEEFAVRSSSARLRRTLSWTSAET